MEPGDVSGDGEYEMKENYKTFLTDPKEHDPNNFIYFIHGTLFSVTSRLEERLEEITSRITNPSLYYRCSVVASLTSDSSKEKFGYETGIKHLATYNQYGLIVEPDSDDVIRIAWNHDLESPLDPKELTEFVAEHDGKQKSLLTLLTETHGVHGPSYNELILMGNQKTRIAGVFKQVSGIELLDGRTGGEAQLLSQYVRKKFGDGIPIIQLPDSPNPNEIKLNPEANRRAKDEFYGR